MSVVHEGYLMKKLAKGGVVKSWRRRYFRLYSDTGAVLRYYDDNGKETGHIVSIIANASEELSNVTGLENLSSSLGTPVFAIVGGHRRYMLQADSMGEMEEWFAVLRKHSGTGSSDVRVFGQGQGESAGGVGASPVPTARLTLKQRLRPAQTHSDRAVVLDGTLSKLGSKVKRWKNRYCKLMDAPYHELRFYDPQNLDVARGCIDMRGIVCFEVSPGESGMLLQSREGKEYRFAALDDESYLAWKEAISNATGIAPNISSQELLGVKEDFRTKLSLSPRGRRQRASLGEAAEQGWVYVTGGKTGVRRQYAMLLENSLQLFAGPEKTGEPLQVIDRADILDVNTSDPSAFATAQRTNLSPRSVLNPRSGAQNIVNITARRLSAPKTVARAIELILRQQPDPLLIGLDTEEAEATWKAALRNRPL